MGAGNYHCAVCVESNIIVATAAVCFYQKPPSIAGGFGRNGYIANVYTRTSHRKQGIGTKLMKMLSELARSQQADCLHLVATEDGAGIYREVGYQEPKYVYLELRKPFDN